MKVLFITSNYLSNNAISNCLSNIFHKMCHNIDISVAHMDVGEVCQGDACVKTYPIDHNTGDVFVSFRENLIRIFRKEHGLKKISGMISYFFVKAVLKLKLPPRIAYFFTEQNSYRALKSLAKQEEFDCIISVSAMMSNHYLGWKLKKHTSARWYAYYFDPYSFNKGEKGTFRQKCRLENKLLERADGIVITQQMQKEFSSCKLSRHLDKAVVCEFPNVTERTDSKQNTMIVFDPAYINCVFTGYIYANIRNPKYFLDLLLESDSLIRFYIVGGISTESKEINFEYYKEKLKDRLQIIGKVSLDEAFRIMHDADILINIGNAVQNQLPSKIFDYISTGKPIVNLCKVENCLTVPYLQKYPYALNLFEPNGIEKETVEVFETFCKSSKGKRVSFEDVQRMYHTSTPEYVANQLMDLLNNGIKYGRNDHVSE